MEDADPKSETPARQAVGLFASSAQQVPAREDVEIASSLLCADSASFMALFDVAVALRKVPDCVAIPLGTSFQQVRAFAASRIDAGEIELLERLVGGRLTDDCYRRLRAAKEDAPLRSHHLSTAADHYAADVLVSLSALLGLPAAGTSLSAPADFDLAAISGLPFLSFLHPDAMEGINA
jgi:hypothetical protein